MDILTSLIPSCKQSKLERLEPGPTFSRLTFCRSFCHSCISVLARAYWARSHHPAVVAQDEELTLNRRMRWGDIRKILHTPQTCSNQFVFCPGFPQALRICCLQYEFSCRRPGPFYHVMRAADIFLRHTQHIAL